MAATGLWIPLVSEPKPGNSIVDAPSLVVPLLSKTSETQVEEDDDVQIINHQRSNLKGIDEYVKASYVAALTKNNHCGPILALKDYYKSSAGHLLLDIGLQRVFERNLESTSKRLAHRLKKTTDNNTKLVAELDSVKKELSKFQELNKPFETKSRFKCPRCRFSTEFQTVFESHLERPHIVGSRNYLCNWCEFKSKNADQMIAHFLYKHKRRCIIDKPLPIHLCRYCPYETSSKRLITSHVNSCERSFPRDSFLGPKDYGENDFPGVTSRLISQEDIKAYERTRNALVLSSYNPNQVNVPGLNEHDAQRRVLIVPNRYIPQSLSHAVTNKEAEVSDPNILGNPVHLICNSRRNNRSKKDKGASNNQSRLLYLLSTQNQPSSASPNRATVLRNPRAHFAYANGRSALINASGIIMAPTQQNSSISGNSSIQLGSGLNHCDDEVRSSSNIDEDPTCHGGGNRDSAARKSNFIICEICDTYTKDLSDLRTHMTVIHELKMHQKMLERRPPLSCQKCKWRFFTDQGLERHLLGVHGLVTSNVQTQVEKNQDSGRCTVCGKAFANKVVAHMKDVHKANLKLVHISYKCTICTAAFELYSLYENHVVTVHSESIRRVTIA